MSLFIPSVLEIEVQEVIKIQTPVIQFPRPENLMVSKSWENITDSIAIPTESIKKRSPSGKLSVCLSYMYVSSVLSASVCHSV